MCFYHDYKWYASISEWTAAPAEGGVRCDECRRLLPAGTVMHNLFQQEHDWCHRCDDGECDCPKDDDGDCPDCKCERPDYGEATDHDECDDCHKFLEAVAAAEAEAGCPPGEARPALGCMVEDINEGGMGAAKRYWKKARQMFPELVASGYLGWLWRKTFIRG